MITCQKPRPRGHHAPLRRGLAVFACLLLAPALTAQQAELVTDRPDQTESALTVPVGTTQLEVGWGFSRADFGRLKVETHELPSTLVRLGLAERFELRLGWTGYVEQEVSGRGVFGDAGGVGDAELGAKVHLRRESGRAPETALLVATSVPVGEEPFTSDRFDPSFRFALSHTLSDRLGFAYNLGMSWESAPGPGGDVSTLSTYLYTAALGIALSDQWGAFVEVFGDIPGSAPGDPAHSFDGGLTYLIHDRLQLDAFAGFGLDDEADDWFAGLGVSVRWPR